ncbi:MULTISPECIES: response regulator transcription factor [unclassified Streptomyces]|uniref:response regulator transcription factor n=1 Tax=unclassified Streptomyces TaxID=2593676 RepID=UPI0022B7014E|nr:MULTISPECIES: response regulator transcription factor [unclassified Streptomyces]MCZ7414723.1 response regulator transcription factor [Streptomyces sp. WMMC897]MCZ7431652.1 response regulator transcription factor [Streptomyces sp. WMMC1477]
MRRIRVLVADGHRVFAESMAAALAAEPDLEPAATSSGEAVVRCLERGAVDGRPFGVLLVDVELIGSGGEPGPGAVEGAPLLARLRRAHPGLRTVVLAARDDSRRAAAAFQAGAVGWVAKGASLSRLLLVVRGALRDETHVPPALLTGVLRELTAGARQRSEGERLLASLTPREHEVLRCMVAGLGRNAVAERLYLSPHTVRTHMQNVLGKLGVHSTLAAVALARRAGIGASGGAPGGGGPAAQPGP